MNAPMHTYTRLASAMVLSLLAGCPRSPESRLARLAPEVSAQTIRHLVHDGDRSFADYCRTLGATALVNDATNLRYSVSASSIEAHERTLALVRPYLKRILVQLRDQYNFEQALRSFESWENHDPQERVQIDRVRAEHYAIVEDSRLSLATKAARLQRLVEPYERYAHELDAGLLYLHIAEIVRNLPTRTQEQLGWLRRGTELTLKHGWYRTACQILGVVGELHRQAGDIDSMMVAWDRALQIAITTKSYHVPRLLGFFASHYRDQGRLALAHDLYRATEQACERYNEPSQSIWFFLQVQEFHAGLGCWELVERDLQRAQAHLRRIRLSGEPDLAERADLFVDLMQARLLVATGRCSEANQLYERITPRFLALGRRVDTETMILHRSESLLACARYAEAIRFIQQGIARCTRLSIPEVLPRLICQLARATYESGDHDGCRRALARFRRAASQAPSEPFRREWIQHDLLEAKLAVATGNGNEQVRSIRRSLERLHRYQVETVASAQAYLYVAAAGDVLEFLHELVGTDAVAGYALEMAWRQSTNRLGDGQATAAVGSESPFETCADIVTRKLRGESGWCPPAASRLLDRVDELSAMHCVYRVLGGSLVRWTATGSRVHRDIVLVDEEQLRGWIDAASHSFTSNAPHTRDQQRTLHRIATALLPEFLVASTTAPASQLILISGADWIAKLPFEALNTSASGYRPLLLDYDVAYLRFWTETAAAATHNGAGVIVADPRPSPDIQRRYSGLVGLDHGLEEARFVLDRLPASVFLSRDHASKDTLLAVWADAPFLYFASHVLCDPEAPFLSFLPLAPSDSKARREASYLDVSDVRATNLDACRLVVLSGCATGAPYVGENTSAPSMGDAFLDAGAGAVIHTLWQVEDESASSLMKSFIHNWLTQGQAPIRALCNAKRARYLAQPSAHPNFWAAYTIALGGI